MKDEAEALDLLWGAEEIAEFIKRSRMATYHLLKNGRLPARKVGENWCASREALRKFLVGEAA